MFGINILFVILIVCIVLVILIGEKRKERVRRRKNEKRGSELEKRVASIFNREYGNKVKVLRNVYLPYGKDGKCTEIDVLAITTYGVFVVECKNFSGFIVGDDTSKRWKQYLGGNDYSFYSPVYQNRTHISVLREYVPSLDSIVSLVVFGEDSNLKVEGVFSDEYVVKVNVVRNLLKHNFREPVLFSSEIDYIYNILKGYTNVSKGVKRMHVEDTSKYA